ncbi:TPA: hypothetical protein ACXNP2_001405 [Stenotrophomonas maltophilia]
MPMLALLLLCAGAFGHATGADEPVLVDLPLQSGSSTREAQPAMQRELEPASLRLFHLRQDRLLRVGQQCLSQEQADGHREIIGEARMIQLWERIDGQWRIRRTLVIDHRATRM